MSAVSATISGRSRPSWARVSPNGASTVVLSAMSMSSPIPRVWPRGAVSRVDVTVVLQLLDQAGPLVVGDPHEVGTRSVDYGRHPGPRRRPHHDGLRLAVGDPRLLQSLHQGGHVVAVDLGGAPAERRELVRDRLD